MNTKKDIEPLKTVSKVPKVPKKPVQASKAAITSKRPPVAAALMLSKFREQAKRAARRSRSLLKVAR